MTASREPLPNRRIHQVFACACAVLFADCACQAHRPNVAWQLACLAGLVVSAGMALWALFHVRRLRWSTPLLVASVFVVQPLGLRLGFLWRELDFEYRLRPRYAEVVRKLASGELREGGRDRRRGVPREIADIAECMDVERGDAGELSVMFGWGGGVPVQHVMFIYASEGRPRAFERQGWNTRPLGGRWFAAR